MAKQFLPKPEIFYDVQSGKYWIQDSTGNWIPVTETAARRFLMQQGLGHSRRNSVTPADRELTRIQRECNISHVMRLPGYPRGVHLISGHKVLVPAQAKLLVPQEGEFTMLSTLLESMLVTAEIDQRHYFFGWLKTGLEALRLNRSRPGQALVLAGPPNSGKSLLQKIITEVFGATSANPYQYMAGRTEFNSELFEAAHLAIEDDAASTDIASRRKFGARLKELTVNDVQRCHPKGRPALSLTRFSRLSVSINDEPENLLIIPPLDASIVDKLLLLKVNVTEMPMPTRTMEEREAFWATLLQELPALCWFLERWEIPVELRSSRFGIRSFQHPDLVAAIDGAAPETQLLRLVDLVLFTRPPNALPLTLAAWNGTAEELQHELFGSDMAYEAKRLLSWPGAAGTYLGRLARKAEARVEKTRSSDARTWRITPPTNDHEQ